MTDSTDSSDGPISSAARKLSGGMIRYAQLVVGGYVGLVVLIVFGSILWISAEEKRKEAVNEAIIYADSLFQFHDYYSEVIVSEIQRAGGSFRAGPHTEMPGFPYPGTMVKGVAERIERMHPRVDIELYSGFPFAWNEARVLDGFQTEALEALQPKETEVFYRFIEGEDGDAIRLARPSVMTETCVACHNVYETKAGPPWKIGDFRGAYEVRLPIADPFALTAAEVTFVMVTTVLAGILGLLLILPVIRGMGRVLDANEALLEDLHQTNDALKNRENLRRDFLAGMSHELRTPLNAILGYAEVIRDQMLGPPDDHRYQGYAGDILRSGRHLKALIEDLFELSALETGRIQVDLVEINPRAAIEAALILAGTDTDREPLDIRVSIDPEAMAIIADRRLLEQVLVNLLTNVRRHGEATYVEISLARSDRDLRMGEIVVRDDGHGFSEQRLAMIRGDAPAEPLIRTANAGAGIGLTLVRRMCEVMGYTLMFENRDTGGACVRIAVPASQMLWVEPKAAE